MLSVGRRALWGSQMGPLPVAPEAGFYIAPAVDQGHVAAAEAVQEFGFDTSAFEVGGGKPGFIERGRSEAFGEKMSSEIWYSRRSRWDKARAAQPSRVIIPLNALDSDPATESVASRRSDSLRCCRRIRCRRSGRWGVPMSGYCWSRRMSSKRLRRLAGLWWRHIRQRLPARCSGKARFRAALRN